MNYLVFSLSCICCLLFVTILSTIMFFFVVIQKIKQFFVNLFEKDRKIEHVGDCVYCQMFLDAKEEGWIDGPVPNHFCESKITTERDF